MIKCEEVLKHLYEYIDNQLDEVSQAEIDEHLKLCKLCCQHYDFELKLREMVVKSCFVQKAPNLLKKKIIEILNTS